MCRVSMVTTNEAEAHREAAFMHFVNVILLHGYIHSSKTGNRHYSG